MEVIARYVVYLKLVAIYVFLTDLDRVWGTFVAAAALHAGLTIMEVIVTHFVYPLMSPRGAMAMGRWWIDVSLQQFVMLSILGMLLSLCTLIKGIVFLDKLLRFKSILVYDLCPFINYFINIILSYNLQMYEILMQL